MGLLGEIGGAVRLEGDVGLCAGCSKPVEGQKLPILARPSCCTILCCSALFCAVQEALIYGEAVESQAEGGAEGAGAGASAAGLRYNLKIVDSLVNIGPIRDAAVGGLGAAWLRWTAVCCFPAFSWER